MRKRMSEVCHSAVAADVSRIGAPNWRGMKPMNGEVDLVAADVRRRTPPNQTKSSAYPNLAADPDLFL